MKIIVIGAGKVGFEIALRLSDEGHDTVVVDKDAASLHEIGDRLDVMTILGNGASPAVLEQAGVREADIVVAVTESDEVNMIACMTAKRFGVSTCVARIRNPEYTSNSPNGLSHQALGIDLVIDPERLAAMEIARLLKIPMASDVEYFAHGKVCMVGLKVEAGSPLAGNRLAAFDMPHCLIVALFRGDQLVIPRGDTLVQAGDRVLIMGRTANLHEMRALVGQATREIQSVAIIGAGRVGRHLVELIAPKKRSAPSVTLFEKDTKRAHEVARAFSQILVITGDATKIDVLRDEGIRAFDALVAVSGEDHTNLLATMLAKQLEVPVVITRISREDYGPLASKAGADAVVVPRLVTASSVLRLVRQSEIVSITLLQGGAETLEFLATEGCQITGRALRDINFPRGALIGAIFHQGDVIIPNGDSRIYAGDRAVVLAKPSAVEEVAAFFRNPRQTTRTLSALLNTDSETR